MYPHEDSKRVRVLKGIAKRSGAVCCREIVRRVRSAIRVPRKSLALFGNALAQWSDFWDRQDADGPGREKCRRESKSKKVIVRRERLRSLVE